MNRTDRLHAMTEELRRAGSRGRTAARLALWLEVSTRTVKRDVTALQQSGLPIWTQTGPGGGYILDAIATLPPINLTPAQAVAIAVALTAQRDAPYAVDGRAALEKLLDVMDPAARDKAEQLAGRVWMQNPPTTERSAVLGTVEEGLAQRRVLALTYRDGMGVLSQRRVEPHLLAHAHDQWYLIGWCHTRQAARWFRLDRIDSADLTTELFTEREMATFGNPPPGAHPVH